MPLSFSTSRSGLPSCEAAGRSLHSTRDPLAEARRFLDSLEADEGEFKPGTIVVVLGPCIDYLGECLAQKSTRLRIVSVQYDAGFRGKERSAGIPRWYPDTPSRLEDFLGGVIVSEDLAPVRVVEWPPASAVFPDGAMAARSALTRSLSRRAAEAATTRVAGRRWIVNSIRNFLSIEHLVELDFGDDPVVVLAAGPTLGRALEAIGRHRRGLRVVAVASALRASLGRGVVPDLVVGTDPGWWNLPHLGALGGTGIPLAMPLSSSPGWRRSPILLLEQGAIYETELAAPLGGGRPLPSHGTVSGSALALAAALGSGPLILAGFDFAATRAESHCSPHAFDAHVLGPESRRQPGETLRWARLLANHPDRLGAEGWRSSTPLSIYAEAIASDARVIGPRIFRLFPSPAELPGIPDIGESELAAQAGAELGQNTPIERRPPPRFPARRDGLASVLAGWKRQARLFAQSGPGHDAADDLCDLFRCVDLPDWTAFRRARAADADAGPAIANLLAEFDRFLGSLEARWLA